METSGPLHGSSVARQVDVSVVLATYNRRALLPRAIESLQRQTLTTWECVVVDDGSSDGTDELIAQIADDRLVYVRQDNQGLARARNAGIAVASGRYITFLDSDDEYRPQHLALRVARLDEQPEVDLLEGGFEVIGESDLVPDYDDPTRMISLYQCSVGGTFFMRRSVIDTVGVFRPIAYGEDTDFIRRARQQVAVEVIADRTYVYYRDTADSLVTRVAEVRSRA